MHEIVIGFELKFDSRGLIIKYKINLTFVSTKFSPNFQSFHCLPIQNSKLLHKFLKCLMSFKHPLCLLKLVLISTIKFEKIDVNESTSQAFEDKILQLAAFKMSYSVFVQLEKVLKIIAFAIKNIKLSLRL